MDPQHSMGEAVLVVRRCAGNCLKSGTGCRIRIDGKEAGMGLQHILHQARIHLCPKQAHIHGSCGGFSHSLYSLTFGVRVGIGATSHTPESPSQALLASCSESLLA